MTTDQRPLIERMQSRGLRMTWQRRILAELLDQADEHLDAEKIYEAARSKDPRIHRATVYRTLNTLKKMGLIDELDLMHYSGDRHFYEVRPSAFHVHLVCMHCGSVQEPSGEFWQHLKQRVQSDTGFQVEAVRLEMGGACAACRSKVLTGTTG